MDRIHRIKDNEGDPHPDLPRFLRRERQHDQSKTRSCVALGTKGSMKGSNGTCASIGGCKATNARVRLVAYEQPNKQVERNAFASYDPQDPRKTDLEIDQGMQ